MAPIRVLRIIARMNVGGPAMQVAGLMRGLDPAEFECRVLTGSVGPDEADFVALRAPDLDLVPVDGLGRAPAPWDDVRALAAVIGEIRRFDPHIVHTHTAKAGIVGRVAARVARVPATVHTFHGHLLTGYFSPTRTRAVVAVERALARRTTRLVAVGSQVRDELLAARIGRSHQYVVVPPGIELARLPERQQARAALGLPPDGLTVAFVARLTPVKRPERFLDTAATLAARLPNLTFVVAGGGDRLAELEIMARDRGLPMRFLGWRRDIETVYAASDLVLLTSDNEGMPVSLIEAGLAGLPAVATDVGSVREVVLDGVTGSVVAPRSDALADAAERILADEQLRERMGAAALAHATAEFGVQRLIDDTANLYRDVR